MVFLHVPYQVPKAEDPTRLAIRAMREKTAEKKMEALQTGILHKQTVPGREHKGCAFHSKPSCIHFKVSGHSAWNCKDGSAVGMSQCLDENSVAAFNRSVVKFGKALGFFSNNLLVK